MKKVLCGLLIISFLFVSVAWAENGLPYGIAASVERITVKCLQSDYVYFVPYSSLKERISISYDVADNTVCQASWGEWDGDMIPLKIQGYSVGETTITLSLVNEKHEKLEGSECIISVEVLSSDLNLSYNNEIYEVKKIYMGKVAQYRIPWVAIAYKFTNNNPNPAHTQVTFDVYQNGRECKRDYNNDTDDQNSIEKVKDGASVYVINCYSLQNNKDIIDITMKYLWNSKQKTATVYFDPITGEVRDNKDDLLTYRELHPTSEPTATPAPTPTPKPTEVPTPAVVTVDPLQADTLEKMFAVDPTAPKVSYGKWQASYYSIFMTYEFFSDGTMTMALGMGDRTGTTCPGIYSIQGTKIEMYIVGLNKKSISCRTEDISYDGEKLIIGDAECYLVD